MGVSLRRSPSLPGTVPDHRGRKDYKRLIYHIYSKISRRKHNFAPHVCDFFPLFLLLLDFFFSCCYFLLFSFSLDFNNLK